MQYERRSRARQNVSALCIFRTVDAVYTGTLVEISAAGALIHSAHRLTAGTQVMIDHPAAGSIAAKVARVTDNGIAVAFELGEPAVTFAMKLITAVEQLLRVEAEDDADAPIAFVD